MTEHIARTLCRAAACANRSDVLCPICDNIDDMQQSARLGECSMWPEFMYEARAVIEAVRDYARLDRRNRPRKRTAFELLHALSSSSTTPKGTE